MLSEGTRVVVVLDADGGPRGVGHASTPLRRSGSRRERLARAVGPGDPRLRRGERLRAGEPPLLPRLGARQLGCRAPARARSSTSSSRSSRSRSASCSRSSRRSSRDRSAWFERPFDLVSALVYTIPSLALFQLLVPVTGLTVTTVEVALVSLHAAHPVPEHPRRASAPFPPTCSRRRAGMGMSACQVLRRVELPLALPAIMAGVRDRDRLDDRARDGRGVRDPGGSRAPDLPGAAPVLQHGADRHGAPRRRPRARGRRRCSCSSSGP